MIFNTGYNQSGGSKILNGKYSFQAHITQGLLDKLDNTRSESYDMIFSKLNFSGTYSFQIPNKSNQFVLIKTNMQLTPHILSSSEKMLLGGNNGVRAVPISEYAVDNALIVNFEWIAKSKQSLETGWLKNIQLTGFLDTAYGANNANSNNNSSKLTSEGYDTLQYSLGTNLNLQPSKKFNLSATLAYRLTEIESTPEDHFSFLMNLKYSF